jgi:hypothetical protein
LSSEGAVAVKRDEVKKFSFLFLPNSFTKLERAWILKNLKINTTSAYNKLCFALHLSPFCPDDGFPS